MLNSWCLGNCFGFVFFNYIYKEKLLFWLLVGYYFCLYKKKKRRDKTEEAFDQDLEFSIGALFGLPPTSSNMIACNWLGADEQHLDTIPPLVNI